MASPKLRVLVYACGKRGELREINVGGPDEGLAAMQAIVGGYIEVTRLHATVSDVCCVVNEEGRLIGLPPNRNGLVGTFFVVGIAPPDFVSLTDLQVAFARLVLD